MLLYIIFVVFALIGRALAHDEQEEITHVTKAGRAVVNSLQVTNNAEVEGSLVVEGNVRILGNETIGGNLTIDRALKVNNLEITGSLTVDGDETVQGNLTVDGQVTLTNVTDAGALVADVNGVVSSANGTAGQVLTSNGPGVAPSFQNGGGGGVTNITGDVGTPVSGAITITGGTSGAVFTGSGGNTLTESFNFLNIPSTSSATGNTGKIILESGGLNPLTITGYNNNIIMGGLTPTNSFGSQSNVFIVQGGGAGLTTASSNVAIGGLSLASLTTGTENVAIGDGALNALTTGSENVGIGTALGNITTGSTNIAIGLLAGAALTGSASSNILIGSRGVAGDNNTIRIGDPAGGGQTKAFIAGIRGVTTTNNDAVAVLIDSAGQLGTVSSSARYKENIQDMASDTDRLLQLRPVIFAMKSDATKTKRYGLIAEEVAEVFPELVVYKDGQPETVRYHDLPAMLLNELQKQHKKSQEQDAVIALLQDQINKLIAQLATMQKMAS